MSDSGNKNTVFIALAIGAVMVLTLGCLLVFGITGAAFLGFSAQQDFDEAKVKYTQIELSKIQNAIEVYQLSKGNLPENLKDLTTGTAPVLPGQGILTDAWEQPFVYERQNDKEYDIFSKGPDTIPNTDDDVRPDKT